MCIIEKLLYRARVKSIVFAVSIKLCDQSDLAIFTIKIAAFNHKNDRSV